MPEPRGAASDRGTGQVDLAYTGVPAKQYSQLLRGKHAGRCSHERCRAPGRVRLKHVLRASHGSKAVLPAGTASAAERGRGPHRALPAAGADAVRAARHRGRTGPSDGAGSRVERDLCARRREAGDAARRHDCAGEFESRGQQAWEGGDAGLRK